MDTKLIAITTASDEIEADMIVGLLTAAGIPAMAKRSVKDGYGTVYQGPFGSFDILIDEVNAVAAQAVLDAEDVPGELDEKPDIPAD
ncbi:MAG: putative signal transducing protein [Candidatus Cryosericum sp.]